MLTNACHFLAQSHATRNVCQQQLQTSKLKTSSSPCVTLTSSLLIQNPPAGATNKSSPVDFVEENKEIGNDEKAVVEAKMAVVMEARAATAQAKLQEFARFKGEAIVPAAKHKRTTIGRAAPAVKDFYIVPAVVEAVPIYMVRHLATVRGSHLLPSAS
ncbi:hypothetical protein F511_14879 [Dorcoceras hygrometricum]|uniref:Uncharacterized protein n=1 Tax=Dorcoceras hygrometricum TaxID=472368 RepID=A0A2Z7BS95_9LAMI|nr:hypothetical protein F511_14879 [Dorcoceras hygrometricum]